MELKKHLLKLRATQSSKSTIDWDSVTVWIGNNIQKHLWSSWKSELETSGFTWQKFLKLMKYHTEDTILWVNDKMAWGDFIGKVIESLEGPLGEMIKRRS